MPLTQAAEGRTYTISAINTFDCELESFLFSLGCYNGEPIKVVSRKRLGIIISLKDGRYGIDNILGEAIHVE